jgi:predicted secreted protein
MAQITKAGTGGAVLISDDSGTTYETIAEMRSWSLEESSDTVECTGMASSQVRKYKSTHKTWSGTMDVYIAYDSADGGEEYTTGDTNVTAITVGTEYMFKFYADASTATFAHYDGTGIVTGISRSVAHDGMAEMSITVQGNSAITIGA